MKRWEIEYEAKGEEEVRRFKFEHQETPSLEVGARELLRHLRDAGEDFTLLDQPHGRGKTALQTLSAAGITVLEPRPLRDPS